MFRLSDDSRNSWTYDMEPDRVDTPSEDTVQRLLRLIAELVREVHPHQASTAAITLDSTFERDLGLDSLAPVELISRVERQFGLALPGRTFAEAETTRDLLRALQGAQGPLADLSAAQQDSLQTGAARVAAGLQQRGLIGAWLGSLYYAALFVVMSPLRFLARPERWLWAIHHYRGTLSASPNFGYEYCLRRIRSGELEGLNLGSWRAAFNGAEAVSADTLQEFSQQFSRYGFRPEAMMPVYGLAESSVGLAFPPPGRGPLRAI